MDKTILGTKGVMSFDDKLELEAIKKALIKKSVISQTDIDAEKPKK